MALNTGGQPMNLQKQVQIYSVDTSFFYHPHEQKIHRRLLRAYVFRKQIKRLMESKNVPYPIAKLTQHQESTQTRIKRLKEQLATKIKKNEQMRTLTEDWLTQPRYQISIFESVLTRTIGIETNTLSTDILVVKTYYFDILKNLIQDGFWFQGNKYVCFTASAGQIRNKKTMFIKEDVFIKHQPTLMCGLSQATINAKGGININKFLAYLALCSTATEAWHDFDIDKAIVVEDMETLVNGEFDYIDESTYQITRQHMSIPINHTDGCGMILPKKSKRSKMIRLPWVKGLLVPFPFDKFIREQNRNTGNKYGVVKDIYGKKHDLLAEKIEVIFTRSQFKLWNYYDSWEQYSQFYKQFKCEAGYCNEEESYFADAKLNYQVLQSLSEMTTNELAALCEPTIQHIGQIGKDKQAMLRILGVVPANIHKNYYQQALQIYPEMLQDTYSKEILKSVKRKMVKEARAGKLDIEGKYTFICPDLYAFCEHLILGHVLPKGLLQDGEVYCKLFEAANEVDCLRSPHLYREHAVRRNVVSKEHGRWFVTNGLYTSVHDTISKLLMFDVDGDKSLVCAEPVLIEVAKRHMQNTVPLYYKMAKAADERITNEAIFNGLQAAYTGGNIGVISNNISKIWNSPVIKLDAIKWLCMENNFTIDYAKTLYKPKRPPHIHEQISTYTAKRVPHFFYYAKDKDAGGIETINQSVVNQLQALIPNPRLQFQAKNIGTFHYQSLMQNTNVELDPQLIELYIELDQRSHFMIKHDEDPALLQVYQHIRTQLVNLSQKEPSYIADVLVEYLYVHKKSSYKTTLWECFGDILVQNLHRNVSTHLAQCECCGERIELTSNRQKYCQHCKLENRRAQNKLHFQKWYQSTSKTS